MLVTGKWDLPMVMGDLWQSHFNKMGKKSGWWVEEVMRKILQVWIININTLLKKLDNIHTVSKNYSNFVGKVGRNNEGSVQMTFKLNIT